MACRLSRQASRTWATSRDRLRTRSITRAPLFDITHGIVLPPSGPAADDDLQDAITRQLLALKASGGELFVFGSPWHDALANAGIDREFDTMDGMHNVHMNQGNAADSFSSENGVFQDGGLLLEFPDHVAGLFLRFRSQFLPTDASGQCIQGVSKEIPPSSGMNAGTARGVGPS